MNIKNLKKVRIEESLSYQDIATKIGVTHKAYWMIEMVNEDFHMKWLLELLGF